MTVTVLYPEDRQIPDLGLEQEVFGPEVRILRAAKPVVRPMTKSVAVQHVKDNIRAIRCISPRRTSRPTRQAARMPASSNPRGWHDHRHIGRRSRHLLRCS